MDISNLTLRNLEYIVAVAEERHFGRASARCNVSQPALSAQVRKLERSLGRAIFDRAGRTVRATAGGEAIIEQARRVLAEAKVLERIAAEAASPLSGPFRLGVIATLGAYLLPHLLPPMRRSYPKLELILVEGLTLPLLAQLRLGGLDAVLASLPVPEGDFAAERLFAEPFLLAVPSVHSLARARMVKPEMLSSAEMLLLEDGHCLRDQALAVCPAQDRTLRERFHGTSLEMLRQMVASGIGYTLMPRLAVPTPAPLGSLIRYRRFTHWSPQRVIALVTRRGSAAARDARELAGFVRANLPAGIRSAPKAG